MKHLAADVQRDEIREICEKSPGQWFDLSYQLKYDGDGKYTFAGVRLVKSSNNSEMKDPPI